jgi:hypothetical protein
MDVITDFLNSLLQEEVFMEVPDGFPGSGDPGKVCKVNRALYGLKQAPKARYARIDSWLIGQGLKRSSADPNLYYSIKNGKFTIILLYVDDLLLTGDNSSKISRIQYVLQDEFEMADLGKARHYLGTELHYHAFGIYLHQREYITKLLERFGMQACNLASLPMDPRESLSREMNSPKIDPTLYRLLVGSLIYVTNTRPDICYAVSNVSRYMDSLEDKYFQVAKQILRYLKGTINYGFHLSSENSDQLHCYSDVDWERDMDTRRSKSGILHKIGDTCIFWTSKL